MTNIDNNHFLAVGDGGKYSHTGAYRSNPDQVKAIITHLKEQKITELTLYFHGGLVDENSAETSILRVMNALAEREKPNAEVLSFIWKTGFLETVRDNLDEIFKSKFGTSLLKWTIRAVTKKLKVDFAKATVNDGLSLNEIEQELNASVVEKRAPFNELEVELDSKAKGPNIHGIDENDQELIAVLQMEMESRYGFNNNLFEAEWAGLPGKRLLSPDVDPVIVDIPKGEKGILAWGKLAAAIVKVTVNVIKRYLKDRDHGLQATVIEEICRAYFVSDAGQWIWGNMKTKAEEMWGKPGCVGFDFMNSLEQELPGITLNLVGHSAGSVAICELLKQRRARNWLVPVKKICWWAPACHADLFLDQIIEHQSDYHQFRMYTMKDSYERNDALVNAFPWIYPSSLLYFISGVLEDEADTPLAGMARYHQQQGPYKGSPFDAINKFLHESQRLVLSKTGLGDPGFESDAVDHGGFSEDGLTLKSLSEYMR